MRTIMKTLFALTLVASLSPCPLMAQPINHDRGYVTISASYTPSLNFADTARLIQFGETEQIATSYGIKSIPGFDASAGIHVWRRLAIGADIAFVSKAGTGSVAAQVPHPLYFNRPRAVTGDTSGLTRTETALNVEALITVPVAARWRAALFGGPSWFSVKQDLVGGVTVTDAYPFDTATFNTASSARRSGSGAGFNVGGDLAYMVRPGVGIGGGIRFSRARVPLNDTVTVDAGGPHIDGGVRFLF
jgi:hypothetical protein